VRALECRQYRAAGRCRRNRAFLVGSGSKLAMESAVALANYLHSEST